MIRIVIAEDQEMLLGVIGSLLNLEEDMEVVGQATNGEGAIALVHQLKPDVCIMDIEMPIMSGLEAADALKSTGGCKVILLTTFARTGNFAQILQSDVRGYLLKDDPSKELIYTIRRIMNGERVYSPELSEDGLNDNERGVDGQLSDGQFTNKDSNYPGKTRTVRSYFSTIINKMKLPTG
ncbi:two-component system, NarL family, response regulator DesR [Mesobacillus persicus]|uniref:Two-component system, NarL family, response regulator DesR n=1 Tax=Mesobacillus persicus TaxID=930146 RepID=A0A1H8DF45_9BACI|nr:response regulator transcription factor [Mesobacillus persicus]SEN05931.1 two-component system, NarL family, response regulator DesR [Mesobacillus persicus]